MLKNGEKVIAGGKALKIINYESIKTSERICIFFKVLGGKTVYFI